MRLYHLSVLHGFRLHTDEGVVSGLRPIDRIVVGVVAAEGIPQTRNRVADIVWGARSDHSATAHCLAQSLYRIRRAAPGLLHVSEAGMLALGAAVESDLRRLQNLATRQSYVAEIGDPINVLAGLKGISADYEHWRDGKTALLRQFAYGAIRINVRRATDKRAWAVVLETGIKAAIHGPLCNELASALLRASLFANSQEAALNILLETIVPDWPYADDAVKSLQSVWSDMPRDLVGRKDMTRTQAPFVGRSKELDQLSEYLATSGTIPRVITIVGERGIGKTRLLAELASRTTDSVRVFYTRCYPTRSRIAYSALASLISDNVPDRNAGPELTSEGRRAAGPISTARAIQHRKTVLADLRTAIDAASSNKSCLLVIDDAQWLDLASAGILSDFIRELPSIASALIIVRRSGNEGTRAARLLERELEGFLVARIKLGPLTREESADLALSLVKSRQDLLLKQVIGVGCGNPLIMEEVARASTGTGANYHALGIPSEIVDSRLRALRPTERKVLSIIVLAGRPVSLSTISWVARQQEIVTRVVVSELVKRDFVCGVSDGGGFVPTNYLIASRCTALVSQSLRKYLHTLLADAARLEGQTAMTVATHLISADAGLRGSRTSLVAARECLAIGAYEAAMYFIEAATETMRGTRRFSRLVRLYCEKLIAIGRLERVADLLEGKDNAIGLSDLACYANVLKQLNSGQRSIIDLLVQVKELYAREPEWLASVPLLTDFIGTAAEIAAYAHDREFLHVLMRRLVDMAAAEKKVPRAVEQVALASRLACLSNGAFDPVTLADRCATIADGDSDRPTQLRVLLAQASAKWYSGSLRVAYQLYCKAYDLCDDSGLAYFRWRIQVERAALLIDLGDTHQAIRDLAPTTVGCSDRERAYALANLGAAAFEKLDQELLLNSAEDLFKINGAISIPWIEVVALSYKGYSELLRKIDSEAYVYAVQIAELLSRHTGLALNEPSYVFVFCARAFEDVEGAGPALDRLRAWIGREVAPSAPARVRLRMEEARLATHVSRADSETLMREVLSEAECCGAMGLQQSGRWLARQIRNGRSVSWRRLAEVHAGANC